MDVQVPRDHKGNHYSLKWESLYLFAPHVSTHNMAFNWIKSMKSRFSFKLSANVLKYHTGVNLISVQLLFFSGLVKSSKASEGKKEVS